MMISDREKVIKKLEECLSASCRGFRTCPYSDNDWDAVKEALALLKEQAEIIDRYHKADMFLYAHGWRWDDA